MSEESTTPDLVGIMREAFATTGPDNLRSFRFAQVVTWADGVIAKAIGYTDIDEARVAAERLAAERAGG
jgi:hypothetical protein